MKEIFAGKLLTRSLDMLDLSLFLICLSSLTDSYSLKYINGFQWQDELLAKENVSLALDHLNAKHTRESWAGKSITGRIFRLHPNVADCGCIS